MPQWRARSTSLAIEDKRGDEKVERDRVLEHIKRWLKQSFTQGSQSPKLSFNRQQERLLITNSASIDELQKDPRTIRISSTYNNSSQTLYLGRNHATQLRYPLSQHPHPAAHPSARNPKINSIPRSKAREQKNQETTSAIMPLIEPITS